MIYLSVYYHQKTLIKKKKSFSYSINQITELRYNYSIFGFFIKNLLVFFEKKFIKIDLNKNFKYCLEETYLKFFLFKSIDNYKINKLNKKNEIYNEIKNKPTLDLNIYIKLSLLFENGSSHLLI